MNLPDILSRFANPQRAGDGYNVRCPCHEDRNPSLSIKAEKDGTILMLCRAGCPTPSVLKAVGLAMRDLFPSPNGHASGNGKPSAKADNGKKVFATADAAVKALAFHRGPAAGQWAYHNAKGEAVGMVLRWNKADGKDILPLRRVENGWECGAMAAPRPLYRLPELLALPAGEPVCISEGEKCCDYAATLGLFAVTSAGGSQAANQTDWTPLAGRSIVIFPDCDKAGEDYARAVAGILSKLTPPATVRILRLPGLAEGGDLVDFMQGAEDLGDIRREVERLADAVPVESPKPAAPDKPTSADELPAAIPAGFLWEPIDSATFATKDYKPRWLIRNGLVANQIAVVGGLQKSLKTSAMIDAAISIASGKPWLGEFQCDVARKVAILSGESGPWALQSTAKRICEAKGLNLVDLGDMLQWQFALPQLAVDAQLEALQAGLARDKVEVAFIDPLYLCLLSGVEGSGPKAENLYQTGPLLLGVTTACLSTGATPVLLHHTVKPSARKLEPLGLEDLAFSGVAEFCRQWVLLSRREVYDAETGTHRLWMVAGGSVGHGGLWAVDVDEGKLGDDFTGRHWQVIVAKATEARQAQRDEKAEVKAEARRLQARADDDAVMRALDALADLDSVQAVAYGRVMAKAELPQRRKESAVERLLVAKLIENDTVEVGIGNKAKRKNRALKRREET